LTNAVLGGDVRSLEEQKSLADEYREQLASEEHEEFHDVPVRRNSFYVPDKGGTLIFESDGLELHHPKRRRSPHHYVMVNPEMSLKDINDTLYIRIEQVSQRIVARFKREYPELSSVMFYNSNGDKHFIFVQKRKGMLWGYSKIAQERAFRFLRDPILLDLRREFEAV